MNKDRVEGKVKDVTGRVEDSWYAIRFHDTGRGMTAEPLEAISGEEIEKFLQDVPDDAKVKSVMQQLLGAGPIPPAK